ASAFFIGFLFALEATYSSIFLVERQRRPSWLVSSSTLPALLTRGGDPRLFVLHREVCCHARVFVVASTPTSFVPSPCHPPRVRPAGAAVSGNVGGSHGPLCPGHKHRPDVRYHPGCRDRCQRRGHPASRCRLLS